MTFTIHQLILSAGDLYSLFLFFFSKELTKNFLFKYVTNPVKQLLTATIICSSICFALTGLVF